MRTCNLHGEYAYDNLAEANEAVRNLSSIVEKIKALHRKVPDVLVDHIHRGLTPVYGDGCDECQIAWPCETIKAVGTPRVAESPSPGTEQEGGRQCPDCGQDTLYGALGGGIKCSDGSCGFWYCV